MYMYMCIHVPVPRCTQITVDRISCVASLSIIIKKAKQNNTRTILSRRDIMIIACDYQWMRNNASVQFLGIGL